MTKTIKRVSNIRLLKRGPLHLLAWG